ncbi:MAG: HlyD family efflux transporter periplasmic adaptor subunit [Saprospiraceae bacterium]|nr:HlyD family efflux transporter periplasmic adaptor subunit [Saprospiraceae bacterium]
MKRINILYLLIIPLTFLWYKMKTDVTKDTAFFYGFAENKETELSHDEDVMVLKIHVVPGQAVKQGEPLMQVVQDEIDQKILQSENQMQQLQSKSREESTAITLKIEQLKVEKQSKLKAIDLKIDELKRKMDEQKNLLSNLKTLDQASSGSISSLEMELTTLEKQKEIEGAPIEAEIVRLKKSVKGNQGTLNQLKNRIIAEQDYLRKEQGKLNILAPSDGLIGNIPCKEGENIQAFKSLINFYEPRPTLVKGFIHESYILEIEQGDSIEVSSELHQDYTITGQVVGLGNRIVEIPERMRKNPTVKSYGREVLIGIPSKNPFLQKEKVFLNTQGPRKKPIESMKGLRFPETKLNQPVPERLVEIE